MDEMWRSEPLRETRAEQTNWSERPQPISPTSCQLVRRPGQHVLARGERASRAQLEVWAPF